MRCMGWIDDRNRKCRAHVELLRRGVFRTCSDHQDDEEWLMGLHGAGLNEKAVRAHYHANGRLALAKQRRELKVINRKERAVGAGAGDGETVPPQDDGGRPQGGDDRRKGPPPESLFAALLALFAKDPLKSFGFAGTIILMLGALLNLVHFKLLGFGWVSTSIRSEDLGSALTSAIVLSVVLLVATLALNLLGMLGRITLESSRNKAEEYQKAEQTKKSSADMKRAGWEAQIGEFEAFVSENGTPAETRARGRALQRAFRKADRKLHRRMRAIRNVILFTANGQRANLQAIERKNAVIREIEANIAEFNGNTERLSTLAKRAAQLHTSAEEARRALTDARRIEVRIQIWGGIRKRIGDWLLSRRAFLGSIADGNVVRFWVIAPAIALSLALVSGMIWVRYEVALLPEERGPEKCGHEGKTLLSGLEKLLANRCEAIVWSRDAGKSSTGVAVAPVYEVGRANGQILLRFVGVPTSGAPAVSPKPGFVNAKGISEIREAEFLSRPKGHTLTIPAYAVVSSENYVSEEASSARKPFWYAEAKKTATPSLPIDWRVYGPRSTLWASYYADLRAKFEPISNTPPVVANLTIVERDAKPPAETVEIANQIVNETNPTTINDSSSHRHFTDNSAHFENAFNFEGEENQAAIFTTVVVGGEAQLTKSRFHMLPFFLNDVNAESINESSHLDVGETVDNAHEAFTAGVLGFLDVRIERKAPVFSGKSAAAENYIDVLSRALGNCTRDGENARFETIGYASPKPFPSKDNHLNHMLAEGRRYGVLTRLLKATETSNRAGEADLLSIVSWLEGVADPSEREKVAKLLSLTHSLVNGDEKEQRKAFEDLQTFIPAEPGLQSAGFKFASYEDMAEDLEVFLTGKARQDSLTDRFKRDELGALEEAFLRSVVLRMGSDDLGSCFLNGGAD